MKRFCAISLATGLMALGGCPRSVYEIEIDPKDDGGFQRTLVGQTTGGEDDRKLPADELARLERLYGNREELKKDGTRFVTEFRDATPQDVGGAGSLTTWKNPLGTAYYYVERFRGSDNLEADLAHRRDAAGELADLIVGWAAAELSTEPGYDKLHAFLDGDFRRDLVNLGIYTWQAESASAYARELDADRMSILLAHVTQYLVERGYFTYRDLAPLFAALAETEDKKRETGVAATLAGLARTIILNKMQADEGAAKKLDWLGDPNRLVHSFLKHAQTTDTFQKRLATLRAEFEKEQKRKQAASENKNGADGTNEEDKAEKEVPPGPADAAQALIAEVLMSFQAEGAAATVNLSLATGAKPITTNGKWDEATGKVTWSKDLDAHRAVPAVCFAAWAEPDRDFQMEHFGEVVLAGQELSHYVLWESTLPPKKRQEWEETLRQCSPGDGIPNGVERFRAQREGENGGK